jgi:ACS family hexuronate transporter-like MFS transporter
LNVDGARGASVTSSSLSRTAGWTIAALATLAMSVSYIDRQVLAALGVSVREALAIDHEQFGWLASAFSMAYLVGTPLAGSVIDRVGARAGLVASMLVWSAVAAAHSLAPSFAVLFALRIALGTAESPSFPAAAQAVRRAVPPRDRSAGIGLLFTGSSIGAMIAAPLAIAMKARFGWRPAFVLTALVGLAWIPFWIVCTRSPAARAALASSAESPSAAHAEAPPSRLELIRDPAVQRAVLLVLASAPAISFVLIWSPQYLQRAFGIAENDLGRYVWLPPLCFDVGAVAIGWLAALRDRRSKTGDVASHTDLLLIAAFAASTLALAPFARDVWTGVAVLSLSLGGGGALYARLTADMLARVHPSHVSTAAGMTAASQSVAYIIAGPFIGRTVDATHSYDVSLTILGGILIPGVLAWTLWPVRRRAIMA